MSNSTAPTLQIYRVGGSIRDELLGLPAGDRDWVVVGATPEQMLAQGFRAVGKDFPVFLHPKTHEEYALARTERKTGPGYKGFAVHFSPDVTLEEDLLRRDLTINAIAQGPVDVQKEGTRMDNIMGSLIDPFNGRADIEARIFRHISPAFREDPVRILRVARFAARFPEFSVAPETLALMREMSAAGEVHALVAERVWQEISRGLMSKKPSRMLDVLADAHALSILIPDLPDPATQPAWLAALDASAEAGDPLPVRFSILLAGMGIRASASADNKTAVTEQARALRAPNDCIDAASRLAGEISGPIPDAALQWFESPERIDPAGLMALFERHDVWRRKERLQLLILAAQKLSLSKRFRDNNRNIPMTIHRVCKHIERALQLATAVDTGIIAHHYRNDPKSIPLAIREARKVAISKASI